MNEFILILVLFGMAILIILPFVVVFGIASMCDTLLRIERLLKKNREV